MAAEARPRRPVCLLEDESPRWDYLCRELEARGLLAPGAPEALGGVVLPTLAGETVCQVWAGVCLSNESRALFHALLTGGSAWAPWEGVALGDGVMARRVRSRLEELEEAGLILCPLTQLPDWVERGTPAGGVVTARRVEAAGAAGAAGLALPPGGLATPLARERARELGIFIRGGRGNGIGTGGGLGLGHPEER